MNYEENQFTANSTWTYNEASVSLKEIISIEDFNNSEWSHWTKGEIGELNQLNVDETFLPLELVQRNKNEPCTLTIDLEDPCARITKVIIISKAKIIEIYGKHGEYICTEKAHLLGSITGKDFFIAYPAIPGSKEITLKFHESSDTIWLYGITLLTIRNTYKTSSSDGIDFTNVEQILRNSNIHLTDNAERAKNFIMNYSIKQKTNGKNEFDTLQGLMQKWNNFAGNNSSKIAPLVSSTNENNPPQSDTSENGNKESDDIDVKSYVDIKLQQLEERMENKLQYQLKEFEQKQNEKLDNIIDLLLRKNGEEKKTH